MATSQTNSIIAESDRTYDIRKQDDAHRYPVTVPVEVANHAQLEHTGDTGVKIEVDTDGTVSLVYAAHADAPESVSAMVYYNTSQLRVPAAIGSILDLGYEEVNWSVEERVEGPVLRGHMTRTLDAVDLSTAQPLSLNPLERITQDIDEEYGEWSQEQFRLYLDTDTVASLGWDSNETLSLSLRHREGIPALLFEPGAETTQKYATKTATPTGENQDDALVNVPNAVVRTLGGIGSSLMWVNMRGSLVGLPRQGWGTPF